MANEKRNNIFQMLIHCKKVNRFTKMIILLNWLDSMNDNYIPNRKLMNLLKIDKKSVKFLLHELEKENLISLFYKNKKRYFILHLDKDKKNIEKKINYDLYDYDWLDE